MTPHTRPLTHNRLLPSDSYLFIHFFKTIDLFTDSNSDEVTYKLARGNNEEIRNITLKQLESTLCQYSYRAP